MGVYSAFKLQHQVRFLLIEGSDFIAFPVGGQLTFSKQLMEVFGAQVALVGITRDEAPVGKWLEKDFKGSRHWFLAVGRRSASERKPFLPARIRFLTEVLRHRSGILALGVPNVMFQAPEALMAAYDWGWTSICYRFSGMQSPWCGSRYPIPAIIGRIADKWFFRALRRADVMLAAADQPTIAEFATRWQKYLPKASIIPFPSRVNTNVFFPLDKAKASAFVGLDPRRTRIACCGRLNHVKGWPLVLRAFRAFQQAQLGAELIFVGGGEDHDRVLAAAAELGLGSCVRITGFQPPEMVNLYINTSDVVVFGSKWEGFSNAMLEALACGKPVVTTDVSGANELVRYGQNGFVVSSRDPQEFALAISRAINLRHASDVSRQIALQYDVSLLRSELARYWPAVECSTATHLTQKEKGAGKAQFCP